ncbi:MAG: type II CRISPR RNA-guided endonuclease Cas9 [Cohaesibacter sp.]|nr:type II CRISPR RNA-guided endonuclease Cas9 [Cohaesibacter sp.]
MKTMRLGLDIGTNSIGWWLYRLDDKGHITSTIDGGVRIFHDGRDPKSKESLAKDRRTARATRRLRDRYLRRRKSLMKKMATSGLMPKDPTEQKKLENLDPFVLRAKGLDEKLDLTELGRAFFHLNQRRGFKSNRKTDSRDNEAGAIRSASTRLDAKIKETNARTFGEYLHMLRTAAPKPHKEPSVRSRLTLRHNPDTQKDEMGYEIYPTRKHLQDEFDALWAAQAAFHPQLTDDLYKDIHDTIFYQRPLKAPEVGRCLFEPQKDRRLAKAHPLFQQRILYETVNQLQIQSPGQPKRGLTLDERDALILKLNSKTVKTLSSATITFKQLAKAIGLGTREQFTLESDSRKGLDCDKVRAIFAHKECFGPRWTSLSWQQQWEIIEKKQALESEEDFHQFAGWLYENYQLCDDQCEALANAPMPEGYGRLGITATQHLLPALQEDVITYSQACINVYGHHSDFRTGECFDELPYYGEILERHVIPGSSNPDDDDVKRYGRITNPTVHIGLNQLRRLLNRIIARYGLPEQIVLELARDLKLSKDQKKKVNQTIAKNTKEAIERGKKLEEMGQRNNGANRLLLRLWEDLSNDVLHRRCPYSGVQISETMLFDGSCDIDHILPYSRTLDDSRANKTLCLRSFNRDKGNKSPWERWGNGPQWDKISPLIPHMPQNKRWRFASDAMDRFEEEKDFLDRQLVDTQYLSRIATEYLKCLYPEKGEGSNHVWVIPGRMTEMLRRHWGLNFDLSVSEAGTANAKNRSDHRHHAIDAAVVAATDRRLVKAIQEASANRKQQNLDQVIGDIRDPYEGFRASIRQKLDSMIVSHRPDHGKTGSTNLPKGQSSTSGQLHNDTAYGLTEETSPSGVPIVVTRKPFMELTHKDLDKIRDPYLYDLLWEALRNVPDKDVAQELERFSQKEGPYQGIRHVRIAQALKVIPITNDQGTAYKGYKGDSNHCYEIWQLPDGKWERVVYTTFEANKGTINKKPHPAAKRLMRLHKKDTLMLDHPKTGNKVMIIAKLSEQRLDLVAHNEANADARCRSKEDPLDYIRVSASSLQKYGARQVYINEIGQLRLKEKNTL